MDQLVSTCVFRGAPASVYKGGEEGRLAGQGGEAQESPTPSGSRIPPPPILVGIGFLEGGKRERGPATSPSPNRTRGSGGRAAQLGQPLLFSTKAHYGPNSSRGVPVTSRYSGKIPISPGTLPISKYRLPVYQSSCIDHFETPRHVHDHIQDSEQPSEHQKS